MTTHAPTLTVTALPLDIIYADRDANLAAAEAAIAQLPLTDVLVLPELFTTSFVKDAELLRELSEPDDGGRTIAWARRIAAERRMAVCGSFAACDSEGKLRNRGFIVLPSGEVTYADKRHLFCLSDESRNCAAGTTAPPVVTINGWRVAMIICYDLRFPAWCRNRGLSYDVMLVPANWPQVRSYAWHHLLIARAIENQAYWVGCDRSGLDDYGCYDGMSQIYDAMGKPIGCNGAAGIVTATLSHSDLERNRRKMPAYNDADNFTINF